MREEQLSGGAPNEWSRVSKRERSTLVGSRTVQNLCQLSGFHLLQLLPTLLKFFERLDDRFGHSAVSFLRTADDRKLLSRGDAFVAVFIVQSNAQQTCR